MENKFDIIAIICAIFVIILLIVNESAGYISFKYEWAKYFFMLLMLATIIVSWQNLKGKFRGRNLRVATNFYEIGFAFHMKGDFNAAISNYKMALNMDPNFIPAHYGLGMVFFNKGNLRNSVKEFRKIIEIDPESSSAYYNLGVALRAAGKMKEAVVEFKKALDLEPNYLNARERLEKTLKEINNQDNDEQKEKSSDDIYSNDIFGFSIKCPTGWKIRDNNDKLMQPEMLVHFTDLKDGNINLMAGPTFKKHESIKDLENLAIRNVNNLHGEMKYLKYINVDDIEAIEAIYTALGGKIKKVGFAKDDIEYVISCGTKTNKFNEYEPIFDACIQSLKFFNKS
jgi:tetratricopeptide (TPR) repeat protein